MKTEKLIKALEIVNNEISKQDLIIYFNENNIGYDYLNDLEMYIVYLKIKQDEKL